jgi:hypothetical protein
MEASAQWNGPGYYTEPNHKDLVNKEEGQVGIGSWNGNFNTTAPEHNLHLYGTEQDFLMPFGIRFRRILDRLYYCEKYWDILSNTNGVCDPVKLDGTTDNRFRLTS